MHKKIKKNLITYESWMFEKSIKRNILVLTQKKLRYAMIKSHFGKTLRYHTYIEIIKL